ncbi:hypothetical protein Purlil1_13046 [Purpureocillium lilacinum]|uniref:Uncharacterized protein n=1 Tax=Purpureocillium lilacinum TaxID=33203 RepID=A0ABR0BF59_PURLI|nr:hypothetical protein Purlil1_13046 [Purpureocillium lilacinum]
MGDLSSQIHAHALKAACRHPAEGRARSIWPFRETAEIQASDRSAVESGTRLGSPSVYFVTARPRDYKASRYPITHPLGHTTGSASPSPGGSAAAGRDSYPPPLSPFGTHYSARAGVRMAALEDFSMRLERRLVTYRALGLGTIRYTTTPPTHIAPVCHQTIKDQAFGVAVWGHSGGLVTPFAPNKCLDARGGNMRVFRVRAGASPSAHTPPAGENIAKSARHLHRAGMTRP